MNSAANDVRSTARLFDVALTSQDEDARWDAVAALHWRGTRAVFNDAAELCKSASPDERALGADILGQLGMPARSFPDETFGALLELLSNTDVKVLHSAILALQHADQQRAVTHVLPFANHPSGEVRYAVAFALCGADGRESVRALLKLAHDQDDHVRNWATFGLGQQSDADTPEIRQTLAARLEDPIEEVRYEAIIGLARRREVRMTGYLKTILHDDPDDIFAREAAAKLLGMEHSGDILTRDLLGALQRRQKWGQRGS